MVNCKDVYERASDLRDGLASSEARTALQEHLETCSCCRNFLTTFNKTIDQARDVLIEDPPEDFQRTLLAHIRAGLSKTA